MTAAGRDAANGPQAEADLGYSFSAYPTVMNFFYNKKADVQGSVEIGMESAAELHYEWLDDHTLRMSVTNPQPGDGGEYTLCLN